MHPRGVHGALTLLPLGPIRHELSPGMITHSRFLKVFINEFNKMRTMWQKNTVL